MSSTILLPREQLCNRFCSKKQQLSAGNTGTRAQTRCARTDLRLRQKMCGLPARTRPRCQTADGISGQSARHFAGRCVVGSALRGLGKSSTHQHVTRKSCLRDFTNPFRPGAWQSVQPGPMLRQCVFCLLHILRSAGALAQTLLQYLPIMLPPSGCLAVHPPRTCTRALAPYHLSLQHSPSPGHTRARNVHQHQVRHRTLRGSLRGLSSRTRA
jgi:hypothetical protein